MSSRSRTPTFTKNQTSSEEPKNKTASKVPKGRLVKYVRWANQALLEDVFIEGDGAEQRRITLTTKNFLDELRSGLLLIAIVQKYNPETRFIGINKKPMTLNQASSNIEKALQHIWSKGVVASNMPSASDIYNKNSDKVISLFHELFEIYAMRPVRKKLKEMRAWYRAINLRYKRDVFQTSSSVWDDFKDCISLVLVFHCLTHPNERDQTFNCLFWQPANKEELMLNIEFCLELIEANGVPLMWSAEDFLETPDLDFLLYQMYLIYERFKNSQLFEVDSNDPIFKELRTNMPVEKIYPAPRKPVENNRNTAPASPRGVPKVQERNIPSPVTLYNIIKMAASNIPEEDLEKREQLRRITRELKEKKYLNESLFSPVKSRNMPTNDSSNVNEEKENRPTVLYNREMEIREETRRPTPPKQLKEQINNTSRSKSTERRFQQPQRQRTINVPTKKVEEKPTQRKQSPRLNQSSNSTARTAPAKKDTKPVALVKPENSILAQALKQLSAPSVNDERKFVYNQGQGHDHREAYKQYVQLVHSLWDKQSDNSFQEERETYPPGLAESLVDKKAQPKAQFPMKSNGNTGVSDSRQQPVFDDSIRTASKRVAQVYRERIHERKDLLSPPNSEDERDYDSDGSSRSPRGSPTQLQNWKRHGKTSAVPSLNVTASKQRQKAGRMGERTSPRVRSPRSPSSPNSKNLPEPRMSPIRSPKQSPRITENSYHVHAAQLDKVLEDIGRQSAYMLKERESLRSQQLSKNAERKTSSRQSQENPTSNNSNSFNLLSSHFRIVENLSKIAPDE